MNEPNPVQQQKRRHLQVILGFLLVFSVIIGILSLGLVFEPSTSTNALLGKKANDFNVVLLQGEEPGHPHGGKKLSLSDFKGSPLILNFWASWCVSCRHEAAIMEAFWKKHRAKGVKMVGIAIQDSPEAAMKFAKYFGKTYILGLDEEGKAGIDYGVTGVPETFFIDRNGVIQHKEAGPVGMELLDKMLAKIDPPNTN
ncbi:MAG: redoxin domain-containing protein [Oligoflexales bacterium]|nr:redoxin domain-containing protein [Oligoflexales bacterium]